MWLLVLIIIVVVVVVIASSAGNDIENVQKLQALADIASSESVFRESLRFTHQKLVGTAIPADAENSVVANFFGRHLELVNMLRTMNKGNYKMLLPVLEKREEQLDTEMARHVGGPFEVAYRKAGKPQLDKIRDEYFKSIGLKL